MCMCPLWPGQLGRLNATLTSGIVWTTTGGLAINTLFIPIWRYTLHGNTHSPPPLSYIQIQPLYHISGRAEESYIPVDALVYSCIVIRFPRAPQCAAPLIHIHVKSDFFCHRPPLCVQGRALGQHNRNTQTSNQHSPTLAFLIDVNVPDKHIQKSAALK